MLGLERLLAARVIADREAQPDVAGDGELVLRARDSRSTLSSILRRDLACLVFCPAMLRRMKSSVRAISAACRS